MVRVFHSVFIILALLAPPTFAGLEKLQAQSFTSAGMTMRTGPREKVVAPHFVYKVTCRDKFGRVKWVERIHNVVTTQGKNELLDKFFKGSSYTATWYMGLAGAGTKAAADTLASHGAWTEQTPYAGNRPAITFGTSSGGSNTATAVSYSITGSATVAGAFVANVNTGTSGVLYSVSDFSVSRSVVNGDTLNVTLTVAV